RRRRIRRNVLQLWLRSGVATIREREVAAERGRITIESARGVLLGAVRFARAKRHYCSERERRYEAADIFRHRSPSCRECDLLRFGNCQLLQVQRLSPSVLGHERQAVCPL